MWSTAASVSQVVGGDRGGVGVRVDLARAAATGRGVRVQLPSCPSDLCSDEAKGTVFGCWLFAFGDLVRFHSLC